MARKVNKNLAGAAVVAIAAVYAAGYAWTQPAHHAAGAAAVASPAPSVAAATTAPPVDTATAIARAIASSTPPPTTSAAAAPVPSASSVKAAASTGYRDGSYTGTGTSRRGNVTVSLTIQNGQIADVKITRTTTYYPVSDISRLPGQVVQRQSANVDMVSGATESSRAFRGAVSQALAEARAAGTGSANPAGAAPTS